MSIRLAPWMFAALLPGCSLILDTGDLPRVPDAPFDAPPPDAPPIDGNRMAFSITGLWPDSRGAVEGAGSKGVPVVIRFMGTNIIDPTVTAAWSDGFADPIVITEQHVSNTFDEVDVGLRIPVRPDLSVANCAANAVMIHFDFNQASSDPAAFDVPLQCLDELADAAALVPGTLYSQIDLTTNHHFGGTTPIAFAATGDITIEAVIDVDATGRTAGPGGCDGASGGGTGGCSNLGGAAGADAGTLDDGGGGGGGGYNGPGSQGTGGAAGGPSRGDEMVVPLGAPANGVENRGSGGGGGGAGAVGGSAGVGGGGGGVISFVAGGEIRVGPGGAVRAAGDDGGNGTSGVTGAGGGGGGGSGGAILIRSGAGVVFTGSSSAWLSAPAGNGGTSPGNDGGAGATGRVRVDQPLGAPSVGSMVTDAGSAAGPAWLATTVPFSFDGSISLQLRAKSGSYGILVNGSAWTGGTGGSGNITVNTPPQAVDIGGLQRGYNEICALFGPLPDAANFADHDEAKSCVEVMYTPGGQ